MRATNLLSLAVLAALTGCASSNDSSWRDAQADRLARLERSGRDASRSLDEVLSAVIEDAPELRPSSSRQLLGRDAMGDLPLGRSGALRTWPANAAHRSSDPAAVAASLAKTQPAPAAAPEAHQDPERGSKLDQRLPDPVRSGPRRYQRSFRATLDAGFGNIMFRADDTPFDDRTEALFARLRLDSAKGAGLHAEWWGSNDDLFRSRLMNDGIDPQRANAQLGGFDVFPHLRFDSHSGAWSLPIRLGLYTGWQQLDHETSRVDRQWLSAGPRIVIEPTLTLLSGDDASLQLFTRFGGDAGAVMFTEEFRNGSDRDFLPRLSGELGGGLRGEFGSLHAELGYRLNHTVMGQTDTDLFGEVDRTEVQRQQVFFGMGLTY
ncbi:MAG: hypothetical protein AB8H80_08040 [Planctomycetota bacterium]